MSPGAVRGEFDMADYDDAEDIMGGSKERPAARARVTRASGPIGKAWAWFAVQPAQTKVIIVGVIVVLGVVVWMMFRKNANPVDTTSEDTPGKFSPLGQFGKANKGPAVSEIPGATPLTPASSVTTNAGQPLAVAQQTSQPGAYRPPVVPTITPQAMVTARTIMTGPARTQVYNTKAPPSPTNPAPIIGRHQEAGIY